jgi:hypothetical protein
MATVSAINDLGSTIIANLRNRYALMESPLMEDCQFKLIGSGELTKSEPSFLSGSKVTLSLFLYRLTVNEHVRQASHLPSRVLQRSPLALDLHFLMTAWAQKPEDEQKILTWAMQQMHERPLLDMGSLMSSGWQADESVHILPTDLSMEDLMRLWEALTPSFRLSVAYVARVVRVDPAEVAEPSLPVVATRFAWGDAPEAEGEGDPP